MQVCRAGMQISKYVGMPLCMYASMRICKKVGMTDQNYASF